MTRAIKIKDGLFLGDEFCSSVNHILFYNIQDLNFIVTNKVGRIVNCSSL